MKLYVIRHKKYPEKLWSFDYLEWFGCNAIPFLDCILDVLPDKNDPNLPVDGEIFCITGFIGEVVK